MPLLVVVHLLAAQFGLHCDVRRGRNESLLGCLVLRDFPSESNARNPKHLGLVTRWGFRNVANMDTAACFQPFCDV